MGNLFSEQLGIQSYAYHNYKGSYYHRDETHPNMGLPLLLRWQRHALYNKLARLRLGDV